MRDGWRRPWPRASVALQSRVAGRGGL